MSVTQPTWLGPSTQDDNSTETIFFWWNSFIKENALCKHNVDWNNKGVWTRFLTQGSSWDTDPGGLFSWLCEVVKRIEIVSFRTHLAGRWRQHGSLLWPECPECQCWARFLKRIECREAAKLSSSLPLWQVHFVCRKEMHCSTPAAHSPLSSSQLTFCTEKQHKTFYFMLFETTNQTRNCTLITYWKMDYMFFVPLIKMRTTPEDAAYVVAVVAVLYGDIKVRVKKLS